MKSKHTHIYNQIKDYRIALKQFNHKDSANMFLDSFNRDKIYSNIRTLTRHLVSKGENLESIKTSLNLRDNELRSLFFFEQWRKLNDKT